MAGYTVEERCTDCGEWTLSNSVKEETCSECGSTSPADPKYLQAVGKKEVEQS